MYPPVASDTISIGVLVRPLKQQARRGLKSATTYLMAVDLSWCAGKISAIQLLTYIGLLCEHNISVYCLIINFGRVAQLVEQRPFKPLVEGSNPSTLTSSLNITRTLTEVRVAGTDELPAKIYRRPHRLAWSRTQDFRSCNRGSNPLGDAISLYSLSLCIKST